MQKKTKYRLSITLVFTTCFIFIFVLAVHHPPHTMGKINAARQY